MGHLHEVLIGLSEYTYGRTRGRLAGLTDDELFWEPAAWCWTVRPIGDGRQTDGSAFPPAVPAFTTIAWRLNHLVDIYGSTRNPTWLGVDVPDALRGPTGTVAGELERLDEAHDRWKSTLDALDDTSLEIKLGPIAEQYAEETRAAFVLHQLDEAIHHGAEIGVLRDLYLARTAEPPALDTVADAAANSCWARVVELAEAGADVNGTGMTPLHLAVAVGATDVVKVLLAHGADTTAKDPQYDATPKVWAEFFHQDEIAALLS
jgi:uncharacterized damage-inducible protein DinB